MATNNFYNHENGIYVIEDVSLEEVYENYKESQLDVGEEPEPMEELDEYMLYEEQYFLTKMLIDDIISQFRYDLPYGMTTSMVASNEYEFSVYNKQGKTIAEVYLQSGYYADTQIIVETDPNEIFGDYMPETQTELYEQYTPHHQRLLDFVSSITTPIRKVGGFSNGEAIYELA